MNVAFIGLGTMGAPMALNILKAGHDVTVHNRSREKETALAKNGAKRAASPMEAVQGAEIIITIVSDTPDVEQVVLGAQGIVHGAAAGSILVDMSTISPTATRIIAEKLKTKGIKMLDAPVSGGSEGAQKGTLTIMIGGQAQDVHMAYPILEAMGQTITHVGPIGAGQLTKAINQIIIAGTYYGVAEGIALGLKAGMDMPKVLKAVSNGAADSWILRNRADNMIANSYPLGFKVQLHRKDLNIALQVARELGVALPVSAYVEQMETGLVARGHGDEDLSAVARCVRTQSGID